jgi:hypothetical protein
MESTRSSPPSPPQPEPFVAGRTRLALLLLAAAVLLLCAGGGAGLAWRLARQSAAPAARAKAPRTPVEVDPPPLPPQPKYRLASAPPPQDTTLAGPQELAASIGKLEPQLGKLPLDGLAHGPLLVLPGDRRDVDAASRLPRHERWEIRFPPGSTVDSYSRQLDFFKIELGVVGAGRELVCVSNLSAPAPATRTQPADAEKRLYLIWQRGAMREADEELLRRAKIDPRGKVVLHLCPQELESRLVQLEEQHAQQSGAARVRKTVFGIKPNDSGGYEVYVIVQQAEAP